MKSLAILLSLGAASIGCYKVVVVWPDKPLEVRMTNCAEPGASDGGVAAADAAMTPEPPAPTRVKLVGGAVKLASKGTLVFVEHASSGGSGNGVTVFEVGGTQDDACATGSMKKILWRVTAGGRWDAQVAVDSGKTLCAEPTGNYADGEVVWTVR